MSNFDPSPAVSRGATPPLPDTASHQSLNKPAGAARSVPVQQALALFPTPCPADETVCRAQPRQLWLSIHLPALPLDALRDRQTGPARAVFEEQQGMRRVLLANRCARKQGITAGLSLNAALALVPALGLLAREPARERQVLEGLAGHAERYTPLVSIEMPDVLLLEIAGSLALFGGVDALHRQIDTDLAAHGFTISLAIAPTPLAALWLARTGTRATVLYAQHLAGALGPLSLRCLQWPAAVCESLDGMGITSVGDCLRLPRQGFARRFGALRLIELDRALGRVPDPRVSYRSPEQFSSDCELPEEQSDSEILLDACRSLLVALERFLMMRQVAVQRLRFSFFHLKEAATHLTLGRLAPDYRAEHWFELLDTKFGQLSLPAPVITIRLQSGRLQASEATTDALLFSSLSRQEKIMPVTRLLERLAARIGDESVHGVTAVAEHRPHYASSAIRMSGEQMPQCVLPPNERAPQLVDIRQSGRLLLRRPLWMLVEPLLLALERDVPHYHGPLRLEAGPERLETGWWDGNGIARDYFVAVNPKGMHLWIYRVCREPGRWYLHGLFA